MSSTCIMASGGCNQSPRCIASLGNRLVYACDSMVVTRDDKDTVTLPHTVLDESSTTTASRVTCLATNCDTIVSGASDGSLVVWHAANSSITRTATLPAVHELPVSCVTVDGVLIVSGSADCRLVVQRVGGSDVKVLDMGHAIPLCVDLVELDVTVLAVGTSADTIVLYSIDDKCELNALTTLKGHTDWVQTVRWCVSGNGSAQLASASQDKTVRLWSMQSSMSECVLSSVLSGHDDWVYSVEWLSSDRLVTSSMDKALIVWEFDDELNVWMEEKRLGHTGGVAVGFYGVACLENGEIVANGYTAGLHAWSTTGERVHCLGGHAERVTDLAWSPAGEYLLTCSADFSTRVHVECGGEFVELARPQVHGHPMQCLASIDKHRFMSAGEEKLLRVFDMPDGFIANFEALADEPTSLASSNRVGVAGASLPSLGLSNKSVTAAQLEQQTFTATTKIQSALDDESVWHFDAQVLQAPPVEQHLMQNTLWPESHKLYGHGFDIYSCAASHSGELLASACKASTAEHAAVLLWDTKDCAVRQRLPAHQLTVTRIRFSPNDEYLLTVGRDRQWHVFALENNEYHLRYSSTKSTCHSRIIWDCAWLDDRTFVTVGRDKKCMLWTIEGGVARVANHSMPSSATAVDVVHRDGVVVVAVGLESGHVHVMRGSGAKDLKTVLVLDNLSGHSRTVRRLAFRPTRNGRLQLASCSDDHFVKIHGICL